MPLAASGPAGRLAQQLEGALGGARIGVGEADVGVDHADEGQQRKIVALGDELGADDEVEFAARRRVELSAQSLDPAGKVGRQHQRADVGKEQRRLLGQPLDARARRRSGCRPRGIPGRVSAGASTWPQWWQTSAARKRCSTSQAAQFGHSNRWPQDAAEGERRIAAPVEEEQRLLAARRAPPRPPAIAFGDSQRPRGGPFALAGRRSRSSGMVAAPKREGRRSQR